MINEFSYEGRFDLKLKTLMWESISVNFAVRVFSKPEITLSAIISVAAPRAIPLIAIVEIKFRNRESRLDLIYF